MKMNVILLINVRPGIAPSLSPYNVRPGISPSLSPYSTQILLYSFSINIFFLPLI